MPQDIITTTAVGTINLTGHDFKDYVAKIAKEYGVMVINSGPGNTIHETKVCFHGRKNDLYTYLQDAYGCKPGEEETFIESEDMADVVFWNFTVMDHYLKESGWAYSYQEGKSKGQEFITRFYDNHASDGTGIRFFFSKMTEDSPLSFTVINYRGSDNEVLDGRAFSNDEIAEGIDYAESFLAKEPVLTPAEAWLKRRGDKINMRPDIDF